MKKLMMAVAIVCAAASVQASSIKWSSTYLTAAGQIKGPDTKTLIYDWGQKTGYSITDAILMNVADYSQSALLEGIRGGTITFGDKALDTAAVGTGSKIAAATTDELSTLANTTISVYYAILATDATGTQSLLVSTTKDVLIPSAAGATVNAAWGTDGGTFSAVDNGSAAYSAAGWYAIPEPTSGLLLLVGGALLALRRRRA